MAIGEIVDDLLEFLQGLEQQMSRTGKNVDFDMCAKSIGELPQLVRRAERIL